jgi:ATP-dependent helicase/nuclease subunit A
MASDTRLQSLPTDAVERAMALDPTRSFIVQAPAGSGKTELLMQRYLTLLAHESVQQPEAVLAITFTKKAAAEMRNRVFEALQNADAPEPEEPHKRASWEVARKVAQRDRELDWNILGNPQRLEIRTVDSFCEKIANRTPLLAGLGQTGNIAADFEPLYADAAQRTLLLLGDADVDTAAAVSRVVRDQDNNFGRVQTLLVEMLGRRDQWLRLIGGTLAWTDEEKTQTRQRLERALQDAIRAELRSIREQLERAMPASLITSMLQFARFGATNKPELAGLADLRTLPGAELDDLPRWRALKEFCLTKGEKLRKSFDADCGFRPGGIHKKEKQDCKDLFEQIGVSSAAAILCGGLKRIGDLPPAEYRDDQWESLLALFRVLLLTVANLRAVFAERGEVDYTEVALAAKAALGTEGNPTDLALHLGYKIQHLLVDEFQDTSVSQTELLERLIQAWSPDSSSTLFVVGDPMQSIYGFRQAEVTLFQRVQ